MATYTTNLNLKKPTTSEMYNVLDWNDNSDKIDTAVGTLNSQISGKANIQKGSIASGSSENVTISRPCLVLVGRASAATTGTVAFVDVWGIVYIQNNAIYSLSITDNVLSISNTSGAYCSYMVLQ